MVRALVIALALAACSKASTEGDTKQLQDQPPPKEVEVPAGLSIGVEVDGAAKPAITSQTLAATKPDFSDVERRAWMVATLLPEAATGVVEASGPTGLAVKFAHAPGLEPVLFLTRRGDVIVSAVDPKDPFPRYHGQGGRLHRPGDSVPHVKAVTKLAITHATP